MRLTRDNTDEWRVTGEDGEAIQAAVAAASAAGGGTVRLAPGTYRLRDSIHLRSGVYLLGDPGAVLLKTPSISSPVTATLGYGLFEARVAHPERFEPGTGVHIADDRAIAFLETVATVVARRGDTLLLDRPLRHDCSPLFNGRVTTIFPLVTGEGVADAGVQNLTLDGHGKEQILTGCRGGGVFLLRCRRVQLRNLEVRHYGGDAVSFQQSADIVVEQCDLHHNRGAGLHPGSGSVRYVMRRNRVHHNAGDGLFYCLRTTHSLCRANTFADNAGVGISIGERDTDHLVESNTVIGNAGPGIALRPPRVQSGERIVIRGNTIGGNGMERGEAQIDLAPGVRDIHVLDNTIEPSGDAAALRVGEGCQAIHFAGNVVASRPQRPADIDDAGAAVALTPPAALPPVGPAALPLDGALHLGIASLEPWAS